MKSLRFVIVKDIVEEDVEKRREASLKRLPSVGAAEEVHDEENDGYDYDDEDFEVHVHSYDVHCKWFESRGPFLESPDNFSGPESYFMCSMFTLRTQILLFLKAEQ